MEFGNAQSYMKQNSKKLMLSPKGEVTLVASAVYIVFSPLREKPFHIFYIFIIFYNAKLLSWYVFNASAYRNFITSITH